MIASYYNVSLLSTTRRANVVRPRGKIVYPTTNLDRTIYTRIYTCITGGLMTPPAVDRSAHVVNHLSYQIWRHVKQHLVLRQLALFSNELKAWRERERERKSAKIWSQDSNIIIKLLCAANAARCKKLSPIPLENQIESEQANTPSFRSRTYNMYT